MFPCVTLAEGMTSPFSGKRLGAARCFYTTFKLLVSHYCVLTYVSNDSLYACIHGMMNEVGRARRLFLRHAVRVSTLVFVFMLGQDMKGLLIIAAVLILAGCQASPKVEADASPDRCGASALRHLLGTSADALDMKTLPDRTRIIRPRTMVTRDYRPDRLNIHVTEAGVISRIVCG